MQKCNIKNQKFFSPTKLYSQTWITKETKAKDMIQKAVTQEKNITDSKGK